MGHGGTQTLPPQPQEPPAVSTQAALVPNCSKQLSSLVQPMHPALVPQKVPPLTVRKQKQLVWSLQVPPVPVQRFAPDWHVPRRVARHLPRLVHRPQH
jgi:hypothetical protein